VDASAGAADDSVTEGCAKEAPHSSQNKAPSKFSVSHWGHLTGIAHPSFRNASTSKIAASTSKETEALISRAKLEIIRLAFILICS
jgi:hypothetical protein